MDVGAVNFIIALLQPRHQKLERGAWDVLVVEADFQRIVAYAGEVGVATIVLPLYIGAAARFDRDLDERWCACCARKFPIVIY